MQHIAIEAPPGAARTIRVDWAMAAALALLMIACWTAMDWAQLRWLNLPDTDDAMRLAQVRDWIAGQAFNDWTQYRLAPPAGAPMHWSRINDLGPAALILLATPVLGRASAEIVAVIAYPGLLFALYLFLSARMARLLGPGEGAFVAVVLAALAYPANALFLPGRIDHHALQVVLIQGSILALMRPGGIRSGALFGAAIALSFGIGLETAPQAAALMAVLFVRWVVLGAAERARALAFGAGLGGVTALLFGVARPTYWTRTWCDGFTPASVGAALAAAALFVAIAGATPVLRDWRLRLITGGVLGGAALGGVVLSFPNCLSGPYGSMEPFLRHAIIDNISEARGLFQQTTFAGGFQAVGMMLAASITAIWYARISSPRTRWALMPVAAVLASGGLIMFSQLRGAYLGAAVAAPILAQLVLAARARDRWRTPSLIGAWCVSAGIVWLTLPERIERIFEPRIHAVTQVSRACGSGDVWHQLDRYPAGTIMAASNYGARIIGGSHHGTVGAGYHRNNIGNRAMYDFFLSSPAHARQVAARWDARYMVLCPTDFSEIDVLRAYPHSLTARMLSGARPAWLEPLPLHRTGLRLYRIRQQGPVPRQPGRRWGI